MPTKLEREFDEAMLTVYRRAKNEAGYEARIFIGMVVDKVTVQALWNVGTDFVLVPFAVISYALGDEAGAHEAIAA